MQDWALNLDVKGCKQTPCTNPNHLWHIDNKRCFRHPEKFKITVNHVPANILEIFLKKGIYFYEYMYSWTKFNKTSLPSKKAFYIKLNNTHISDNLLPSPNRSY